MSLELYETGKFAPIKLKSGVHRVPAGTRTVMAREKKQKNTANSLPRLWRAVAKNVFGISVASFVVTTTTAITLFMSSGVVKPAINNFHIFCLSQKAVFSQNITKALQPPSGGPLGKRWQENLTKKNEPSQKIKSEQQKVKLGLTESKTNPNNNSFSRDKAEDAKERLVRTPAVERKIHFLLMDLKTGIDSGFLDKWLPYYQMAENLSGVPAIKALATAMIETRFGQVVTNGQKENFVVHIDKYLASKLNQIGKDMLDRIDKMPSLIVAGVDYKAVRKTKKTKGKKKQIIPSRRDVLAQAVALAEKNDGKLAGKKMRQAINSIITDPLFSIDAMNRYNEQKANRLFKHIKATDPVLAKEINWGLDYGIHSLGYKGTRDLFEHRYEPAKNFLTEEQEAMLCIRGNESCEIALRRLDLIVRSVTAQIAVHGYKELNKAKRPNEIITSADSLRLNKG